MLFYLKVGSGLLKKIMGSERTVKYSFTLPAVHCASRTRTYSLLLLVCLTLWVSLQCSSAVTSCD